MPTKNGANSTTKIAIVTGGSRGLGRSTVLSLARRGVDSIFTYHASRAEAEKVVGLVAEVGRKAVALQLDTGDVRAFDPFVQSVRQALAELNADRFDYLVNNAGTSLHKAFDQTTEEELDQLYNVHFKGVFFLTQKLLPLLNDGGRIVNISSGLARFTNPGSSAYGSMKGAVEVLTRYLAKELGPRGIAVNTVAPGRHRDRLQRRHGPRQPGGEQAGGGDDGARPRRPARRHRPDDRRAAFRRQSLDQRAAHRSLGRHGTLVKLRDLAGRDRIRSHCPRGFGRMALA